MPILVEIKDLHVEANGKPILKGVDLSLEKGKIHVLMGPNGSGKSTLANVLMGHPGYTITKGSIYFEGNDITDFSPEEKAKLGIFLSFQYPREIQGVPLDRFLYMAYSHMQEAIKSEKKLSVFKFHKRLKELLLMLNLSDDFIKRSLNVSCSGGEKKKLEMLQLLVLNPVFAILDEVDSGLDVDALKIVGHAIQEFKKSNADAHTNKTLLVVTHYQQILQYIVPDIVHVMKEGKISNAGSSELLNKIQEEGFATL